MKNLTRIVFVSLSCLVLLLTTPACEMQSAAVTVPGYAEKSKEKAAKNEEPEPSNPAPPTFFPDK